MKKLFSFALGLILLITALAAPTSVQAVERDAYYPTVIEARGDSITLRFSNPNSYPVCWEYRTDGDTSEVIGDNYNSNYDDLYPFTCQTNDSIEIEIPVDQYVEVRSVFGAERDHDFGWVRYDLKPYFNLAVCYEGEIGEQATEARFGYFAENLSEDASIQYENVTNGGILPQDIPVGENSSRVWSSNLYDLNSSNTVWTLKIDGLQKTTTIDALGGENSMITESNQCAQEAPEPSGLTRQKAYPMAYTVPSEPIEGFENYTCNVITKELGGELIKPSEERVTMVCSKGPEDVPGDGFIYKGDVVDVAIVYRYLNSQGEVVKYTWRGMRYPFKYGQAEDQVYTMNGRKLEMYPRIEGSSVWIRNNAPEVFGTE